MKKKIVISIIVVIIAAVLVKDTVIKLSVEGLCKSITGVRLNIGSLKSGVLRSVIDIRDMRLYNPEGFPDSAMADIPEIYVDYDLPSILGGKIHLRELRFELKELNIVKNKNGKINVNFLKAIEAQKKDQRVPGSSDESKAAPIEIDVLVLKAGKVVYTDLSRGNEGVSRTFNVNLDERYENISDPYVLVRLIISKTLAKTTLSNIVRIAPEKVEQIAAETVQTGIKTVEKVAGTAEGVLGGVADIFKPLSGKAKDQGEK